MLNKVSLIGRLGRDPEVRRLNGGDRVVNMRIATSERWKNKDGEKQERTEWHSIVIWNEKLGEIAERFLKKGDLVYLEGQLQTRQYDKDGVTHYATDVVLQKFGGEIKLLPKADSGEREGSVQSGGRGDTAKTDRRAPAPQKQSSYDDLDDDIPF